MIVRSQVRRCSMAAHEHPSRQNPRTRPRRKRHPSQHTFAEFGSRSFSFLALNEGSPSSSPAHLALLASPDACLRASALSSPAASPSRCSAPPQTPCSPGAPHTVVDDAGQTEVIACRMVAFEYGIRTTRKSACRRGMRLGAQARMPCCECAIAAGCACVGKNWWGWERGDIRTFGLRVEWGNR